MVKVRFTSFFVDYLRCLAFCNLAEKPEAGGMEGVPYRSTMNKKIDKAALAARILALEGISSEDKSALLELLRERSYGLYWEDSPEEVEALLREKLPVLTEDTTKRIIADTTDKVPNHILIEGDNYPALVALQYAYEGKVDVIYIDPPYNTGNKDFVYNDSYVDSEDSYRHSKWLSFMSKRLRIAKRLLSDRGVIFISIDDNEQADLKLLCDKVFGSRNFCGEIIWRKKSGGGQTDAFFVTEHEYIPVYRRTDVFQWNDPTEAKTVESFSFHDDRGYYNRVKLEKWGSSSHKEDRPSMYFPIKDPQGNDYFPIAPDNKDGRWRVGLGRMNDLIDKNLVEWKNGRPYEKVYYVEESQNAKVIKSRSIFYTVAETGDGSRLLNDIFGEKDLFQNPKPLELIKELISHNVASIILDFFAGSGTTLHATMQLNAEDGGHRQCILVTNNENNICEEVTYERNKRVIQGYTTPKGQQVEGLKNNNLRYYKVDFVDREKTVANQKELMKASTDLLCIKENLYQEETCFEGLKLHPQIARYFTDGVIDGSQMLIIYEPNAIPVIVKRIEQMPVGKENKLKVYVMAEGQYPYTEDFETVLSKVELRAMPHALYQAMRQVLPPLAEAENTEPEMEVSDEEADGSIYKSEEL